MLARRRRDEAGVVALVAGIVTMVLLVVSAFVVDLGMTWERRGDLQQQADEAAVFAAEALPVSDDASRLRAARRVAYYIACNPVSGQLALDPAIPDCPATSSSTSLDDYAHSLLDDALVSFPSSSQVQVVTPRAKVRFAFAGATGVEDTVQQKSATAKVSSPGGLLPIGLSLQCLAAEVNQAGLGSSADSVLPISYITPGAYSSGGGLDEDSEPTFVPWESAYSGTNASSSVTVSNPSSTGSTLTMQVGSPGLLPTLQGVAGGDQVVFKRGGTTVGPVPASSVNAGSGLMAVPLPADVSGTPGIWHVKVKLFTTTVLNLGLVGSNPKWSTSDVTFAVYPSQDSVVGRLTTAVSNLLDLPDTEACGRLLDSPRVQDGATPALTRHLQEGIDHSLTRNDALLQALSTQDLSGLHGTAADLANALQTTVAGVLSNPAYGLLGCASSAYNRLDDQLTYDATQSAGGAPANCARIRSDASAGQELTDGLLKTTPSSGTEPGYGRLSCLRVGACNGATTTLPGFSGTFNDDSFSDFLGDGPDTVLDSNLAYATDTYLVPGLPVVTPSNQIEESVYSSPRFGWVPVLSYVDLNSAGEADYPILTFRPVFLDNGSAPGLKIAGLDSSKVVDRLGPHLQHALTQAIEAVRASLGYLSGGLDTVLSALGIQTVLDELGQGNVSEALEQLSSSLNVDMGTEKAGLVIANGQVKAARFMPIAPDALPPLTDGYDGPLTDYVGVGPKIVRLVR